MYLIHGEQVVNSRTHLNQLLDAARQKQHQIHRCIAKNTTISELQLVTTSQSLFDTQPKTIVIEELHGLTGKKKLSLIDFLRQTDSAIQIILWEKKTLTPTQLKAFPQATIKLFPASKAVFAWLDTLENRNQNTKLIALQAALKQDGAELCFAMLSRQAKLYAQVQSSAQTKEHPFVIKKITSQLSRLPADYPTQLLSKLVLIDYQHKTGQLKLSLAASLEQLMIE